MVKGFAHAALYTDKFAETIKFYEDIFEAENMGCFDAAARGCWLRIGADILEVFESEKLPPEGAFKHIAIACEDVDALHKKALAQGAAELVAPKDAVLALKVPVAAKLSFVTGVNGEQIELFQQKER